MGLKDRRKFQRIDTSNLVSCIATDENGTGLNEYIARALNVSPGGILIETFQRIDSEHVWLASLDVEDNLIEIKGEVVHCAEVEDGKFECGIRFQGTHAESKRFAIKMVYACNSRKTIFLTASAA